MPKPLHLIVACAENRVIGHNGRLPWTIPEDWAFFKQQTAGQVLIIGRHSFETWRSAAEDGRQPVVVTRDAALATGGVRTATTFNSALAIADNLAAATGREIYVCGGARIYAEALALAAERPLRLHLTLIHAELEGDTLMPDWRHLAWREVSRRASADATWRYTFFEFEFFAPRKT